MAEQVVNEEEKENGIKRAMRDPEEGSSRRHRKVRVLGIISDDDQNDNGDDKKDNIWEEWQEFLEDKENKQSFMQLSPERHNVIWCGKDAFPTCPWQFHQTLANVRAGTQYLYQDQRIEGKCPYQFF